MDSGGIKMSLVDDAIKAYTKDQLEIKEDIEKENKKFIEDGINNIREKFGDNLKVEVISDHGLTGVVFLVEGLKMRLKRYQGYYNIYLVQTCPKCKIEYEEHIISLKDIGKALQEGHASYDCEKILKDREPVKELTTEEKLLDALRTFILEINSS